MPEDSVGFVMLMVLLLLKFKHDRMAVNEKLQLYPSLRRPERGPYSWVFQVVTSSLCLFPRCLDGCDFHTLLQPMKAPGFRDHVKAVTLIL